MKLVFSGLLLSIVLHGHLSLERVIWKERNFAVADFPENAVLKRVFEGDFSGEKREALFDANLSLRNDKEKQEDRTLRVFGPNFTKNSKEEETKAAKSEENSKTDLEKQNVEQERAEKRKLAGESSTSTTNASVKTTSSQTQTQIQITTTTKTASAKSPTIQIDTRGSLDAIVGSVLQNSQGKTPKIVIINQPVPDKYQAADDTTLEVSESEKAAFFAKEPYPPTRKRLPDHVVFTEADGMLNMLNHVQNFYASFRDLLPKDTDESFFATQPVSKGSAPRASAMKIVEIYGKLRAMVQTFLSSSKGEMERVEFLQKRAAKFSQGILGMMGCYLFSEKYANAMQKAAGYQSKDTSIALFIGQNKEAAALYQANVNAINASATQLAKLTKYFKRQLSALQAKVGSKGVVDFTSNFESTMSFAISLVTMKQSIVDVIATMKTALASLRDNRPVVENTLYELDTLANFYINQSALAQVEADMVKGTTISSSVWVFKTVTAVLGVILMSLF